MRLNLHGWWVAGQSQKSGTNCAKMLAVIVLTGEVIQFFSASFYLLFCGFPILCNKHIFLLQSKELKSKNLKYRILVQFSYYENICLPLNCNY